MKYFALLILTAAALFGATSEQDDPIQAKECETVPIIDGIADDACWAEAKWQAIDQVWIDWGKVVFSDDFTGKFKVTWSSETDKIYFLVEIVDDVLVDGYKYPQDGYYNWDVVEIFFDEDASGGDHKLNQNAFAYHITAGNDEDDFQAMDLAANWKAVNYSDHLDCKITNENTTYVWEIEMTVYNENYDPNKSASENPTEELFIGKQCGLSIAYCDNDDPNEEPKTRDNFIGSVPVPQSNYNDHWMNADWFGHLELTSTSTKVENVSPQAFTLYPNYPNPFNPQTTISYQLNKAGNVQLDVYDSNGRLLENLVSEFQNSGLYTVPFHAEHFASGLYFYKLSTEYSNQFGKMLLIK